MNALIVAPLAIPLLTAAVGLTLWWAPRWRAPLAIVGTLLQCAAAIGLLWAVREYGIVSTTIGGWPKPFGITLVADLFSATLILLAAVLGFLTVVYSLVGVDMRRQRFAYFPLLMLMLMGICGAFLTGDLFNLYVWFEVLLIASFVLLALGGERPQLEGAVKYVTINLLSSAIFLAAVGIVYGVTHTLNLADIAQRFEQVSATHPALVSVVAVLLLISFGIKSAIFPLFFWLPASYPTPPAAIASIFAALLTKVGVYSLVRVFTLVFPEQTVILQLLLVLAVLTMVIGVLGAVAQYEMRRILAFHSISQIGYMVLGLSLLISEDPVVRRLALSAVLIYMLHHSLVKGNLFLIAGVVQRLRGTTALEPLGGLVKAARWLAALFLITALSLAGMPLLTGFWAKLNVILAGFRAEQYLATGAAILTGLLTLISMIKIWNEVFWKKPPDEPGEEYKKYGNIGPSAAGARRGTPQHWAVMTPIVALTVLTLVLGLVPGPLLALADDAAGQLLDREAYFAAVGVEREEVTALPEATLTDFAPAEDDQR